MAYTFPAIIHRIESYLIAVEACSMLHLPISADLALECMTKDSRNTDEHGEEQVEFQRGMGNNYERLEFLGDCFLKMATSISLYTLHPDSNEFDFHVKRMLMICNKNLMDVALQLKLYEFIRSQTFNRYVARTSVYLFLTNASVAERGIQKVSFSRRAKLLRLPRSTSWAIKQ